MSIADVQGVGACRSCHAPLATNHCADCDPAPLLLPAPIRGAGIDVRLARRADPCRCSRPLPQRDLDGGSRCNWCGRAVLDAAQPRRSGPVLYLCRQEHPTERDALAEAARRAPNRRVLTIAKRKVRAGRVVSPQGRPSRDGDLGRPIWQIQLAA